MFKTVVFHRTAGSLHYINNFNTRVHAYTPLDISFKNHTEPSQYAIQV